MNNRRIAAWILAGLAIVFLVVGSLVFYNQQQKMATTTASALTKTEQGLIAVTTRVDGLEKGHSELVTHVDTLEKKVEVCVAKCDKKSPAAASAPPPPKTAASKPENDGRPHLSDVDKTLLASLAGEHREIRLIPECSVDSECGQRAEQFKVSFVVGVGYVYEDVHFKGKYYSIPKSHGEKKIGDHPPIGKE
ncbi:MAG: hypothetical protein AAB734_01140, partial [Patescibacteria group bacterium]